MPRTLFLVLCLAIVCAVVSRAHADAKTRELAAGYDKEVAACHRSADGVTKVRGGAQALVDGGSVEYEADLRTLTVDLGIVQGYCDELGATLALLGANPDASYKSLERQIDDHDNKIRALRQASKKALADVGPVMSKLIPVINAHAGATTASTPAPSAPVKMIRFMFPSKREISVPLLTGKYELAGDATTDTLTYKETSSDHATVSAVVQTSVHHIICKDARSAITSATDLTSEPMRALGVEWYVAYMHEGGTRRIRHACLQQKTLEVEVTIDEPAAASHWPELEPVAVAMLAARK